jgi:hypothetical protein
VPPTLCVCSGDGRLWGCSDRLGLWAARAVRGIELTFPVDKEGRRKREASPDITTDHITPERKTRKKPPESDVGKALRSVYDGALNEDIPPEMLDLLGKLG